MVVDTGLAYLYTEFRLEIAKVLIVEHNENMM